MQKRRFARKAVRWGLLAACLLMALAIVRLFWWEASDGREARETERTQSAPDIPSVGQPPAAPAQ